MCVLTPHSSTHCNCPSLPCTLLEVLSPKPPPSPDPVTLPTSPRVRQSQPPIFLGRSLSPHLLDLLLPWPLRLSITPIPLRDPDLWCLYRASLALSTPPRTSALRPKPAPPKLPSPHLSPHTSQALCFCPTPNMEPKLHGTCPETDSSSASRSSQGSGFGSRLCYLQAQAPGPPGPQPPCTPRPVDGPQSSDPQPSGAIRSQPSLPARLGSCCRYPALSCSVPRLIFLKRTTDWSKKPPLYNQHCKRPFSSSTAAWPSFHGPGRSSSPSPLGPTHAPHSSDTCLPTSSPVFTLSPQLRDLSPPELPD